MIARARGAPPTPNASACGQYSSVTFSASWRVVTTPGGSPFAEVRSITTSSRPRSTAYCYVAVNAPSSSSATTRSANPMASVTGARVVTGAGPRSTQNACRTGPPLDVRSIPTSAGGVTTPGAGTPAAPRAPAPRGARDWCRVQ